MNERGILGAKIGHIKRRVALGKKRRALTRQESVKS